MLPVLITLVIIGHIVKLIALILYLIVGFLKIFICLLKDIFCELADLSFLGISPFGFFDKICSFLTAPCNFLKKALEELKKIKEFTITLPNLVYSGPGDCELCSCAIVDVENQTQSAVDNGAILPEISDFNESQGMFTILPNFQEPQKYLCPEINKKNYYYQLLVGSGLTEPPSYETNAPQVVTNASGNFLFTSNLTIPERLNLFSTKAKYFDTSISPGGGVNRIKVTFQSDLNDPNVDFHYDNVIVLMVSDGDSTDFSVGKMISFTDPNKSSDPNLDLLNDYNVYGNKAITGETINNPIIVVNYANPNGSGNLQKIYVSNQDPTDALFARFAIDMEYFQVIENTTVNQYLTDSVNTSIDSLRSRFIGQGINYLEITPSIPAPLDNFQSQNSLSMSSCYTDFGKQKLIFLVRGVDPYSTRVPCQYDLSRLYGYAPGLWNQKVVTGNFKLNIPIQGSLRCVKHDAPLILANSGALDIYSNTRLFYNSYHFEVGSDFQSFVTNTPSYYSTLDEDSIIPENLPDMLMPNPLTANGGVVTKSQNYFTKEFINSTVIGGFQYYDSDFNVPGTGRNRGYFDNESVEGGALLLMRNISTVALVLPDNEFLAGTFISAESLYYCKRYLDNMQMTINPGLNNRRIVMRSDRLPMSTSVFDVLSGSYPLHTNQNFSAFVIEDNGTIINPVIFPPAEAGSGDSGDNLDSLAGSDGEAGILESLNPNYTGTGSALAETFSCEGIAPLSCYQTQVIGGISTIVVPPRDINEPCWTFKDPLSSLFGVTPDTKFIMEGGCYVLLTFTLTSLLKDWQLVIEWIFRTKVNFALCRNIFSHMFTNSWINGSLFMFPFRNNRRFTGPNASPPNAPYSCYCHHLVFLDEKTNSFYYRSSPYDGNNNDFIGRGRNAPGSLDPTDLCYGNERYLMYPTTMVDLGPRSGYITELTFDDNYRGFFADKINSTSFNDVSELLNTFAMSRLSNASFLGQILAVFSPTPGVDPVDRFFSRQCSKVDGDYAQMAAINSQMGVTPYEDTEYNSPTDMYSSGANVGDNVFGVFYKSDLALRDLLSPRREIISFGGPPGNFCTFNKLPIFSQLVPFYQWDVKPNTDPANQSIFGTQTNDWFSNPVVGNSVFNYKYQDMDRIGAASRFPQPVNGGQENYFKGYIFNVAPNGLQTPNLGPFGKESSGNPFHFYFGLNMGKSAYDRFLTKWVKTDIVEL